MLWPTNRLGMQNSHHCGNTSQLAVHKQRWVLISKCAWHFTVLSRSAKLQSWKSYFRILRQSSHMQRNSYHQKQTVHLTALSER